MAKSAQGRENNEEFYENKTHSTYAYTHIIFFNYNTHQIRLKLLLLQGKMPKILYERFLIKSKMNSRGKNNEKF